MTMQVMEKRFETKPFLSVSVLLKKMLRKKNCLFLGKILFSNYLRKLHSPMALRVFQISSFVGCGIQEACKQAAPHGADKLLEALDPSGKDITVLGSSHGDIVWLKWVHPHLTNGTTAPGMIIFVYSSWQLYFAIKI